LSFVTVAIACSVGAQIYQVGPDASKPSQAPPGQPQTQAQLGWGSNIENARLARAAPTISAAVIVTGPLTSFQVLRRAVSAFSPDVNVVGIRVEHGAAAGLQRIGGLSILTIGSLGDLPRALSGRLT